MSNHHQQQQVVFNQKMLAGTRNVIDSSKDVFHPIKATGQPSPAVQFAFSIEQLIDVAPNFTPHIEDTLDNSTQTVRQFIKSASAHFGKISDALETF